MVKSDSAKTRARAIIENREKDLFDAASQAKKDLSLDNIKVKFGIHGEYIVDLAKSIAFNEYRRFILIVENHGAVPNFQPDAMVEVPAYLGSDGPETLKGAHVFVGLSAPNILTAEMLRTMAENPLVFALANPDPGNTLRRGQGLPPRYYFGNGVQRLPQLNQ